MMTNWGSVLFEFELVSSSKFELDSENPSALFL